MRPLRHLVLPVIFYLAWFVVLTWPAVTQFSTHLFTDDGDGMQNVWNLWWMHKALVELHTSPWYTTYLHFPHGTTLLGHTLNPFNGLMATPLLGVFSLTVTHNVIIVFSFVVGGLTAYALCWHVSGSRWGSLWGGFVFTFSSFHFAHAEGHMQMVALEWIPLFLLCWLRWLDTPTAGRAAAAAGALVLVFLCDLYFLLFSVLAAGMTALWWLWGQRRQVRERLGAYLGSGLVFGALAGVPVGTFAVAFLLSHRQDPFVGAHDPATNGMDLLAPFIYGGHWRFAAWTKAYWQRISGNIHESSLHLGWSVLAALAYCAWHRRRLPRPGFGLWVLIAVVFALLALGPTVRIWGTPVATRLMPYELLATLVPPLKLSGAAARFFVMTHLAAGVLLALAFPLLRERVLSGRVRAVLAVALLAFEHWPAPLPLTRIPVPPYVRAVAAAPGTGGVIDLVNRRTHILYFQTIHEKPIALGYIARFPLSTITKGGPIMATARQLFTEAGPTPEMARKLAAQGFRHVIARRTPAPVPFLLQRYADSDVIVYDLFP